MAKVNFNKLTLGHPLTKDAVWDNLDQCATALSGNISLDQRRENRSIFTFALQKVRVGTDPLTEGMAPPTGFVYGFPLPMNETGVKTLNFFLPPLQEFFDSSLVSDFNTPDFILESLSVSFDNVNQQYPLRLSTGLPDNSLVFDQDLEIKIKTGNSVGQVTIPKVSLNISNEDVINRPNPTVSADIGAVIDPYSKLELSIKVPISSQSEPGAGTPFLLDLGIDNLFIRASFSAPIVQRDTLIHTVSPQNAPPLVATARSAPNCVLSKPADGSLIKAGDRTSASTDGLQDAFEQLDREVREGLGGSLTRWSERREHTEALMEDQGYFCITIPMFNHSEVTMIDSRAFPSVPNLPEYRNLQGYVRPTSRDGAAVNALIDRAVIPIVAPGTIHHIGVFFSPFQTTNPANHEFYMDFGLAIGTCPGSIAPAYQQVSYVSSKNITYSAATQYIDHFFAPIAYSTAALSPALGKGYETQGRPYFFGNQIDTTGGVLRTNVANPFLPGSAEAAPATNGLEQFIEVRTNILKKDPAIPGLPQWVDIDQSTTNDTNSLSGWSGVVVCLYGKMALVE